MYDGDTLTLTDGQKIRLLQVDTPELGSGECYSRAAHRVLLSLVPPGTAVAIDTDPALDRVDRYGRLLRYVLHGGLNVNLELVRRGAAAPYFYRGDRGRYAGGPDACRAVGEGGQAGAVGRVSTHAARS